MTKTESRRFDFRHQSDGLLNFMVHEYKAKGDQASAAWRRDYFYQAHSAVHDELARRREQHGQHEGRRDDGL